MAPPLEPTDGERTDGASPDLEAIPAPPQEQSAPGSTRSDCEPRHSQQQPSSDDESGKATQHAVIGSVGNDQEKGKDTGWTLVANPLSSSTSTPTQQKTTPKGNKDAEWPSSPSEPGPGPFHRSEAVPNHESSDEEKTAPDEQPIISGTLPARQPDLTDHDTSSEDSKFPLANEFQIGSDDARAVFEFPFANESHIGSEVDVSEDMLEFPFANVSDIGDVYGTLTKSPRIRRYRSPARPPTPHNPFYDDQEGPVHGPQSSDSRDLQARPSSAGESWARLKKELGEQNDALDTVMGMVGLEHVKLEFLRVKATIEAARQRKGWLRWQDLNLLLLGNPGTGKTTLAELYHKFLLECQVWRDDVDLEYVSGFELQSVDSMAELEEKLDDAEESGSFFFLDNIDQIDSDYEVRLLGALTRHARKMVVVMAGSVSGTRRVLGSLPHGRWQWWRRLQIKDYDDEQLRLVLLRFIEHNHLKIEGDDESHSSPYPLVVAKRVGRARESPGFGNVHDLAVAFQKILQRQAHRLQTDQLIERGLTVEPDELAEGLPGGEPKRHLGDEKAPSEYHHSEETSDEPQARGVEDRNPMDRAMDRGATQIEPKDEELREERPNEEAANIKQPPDRPPETKPDKDKGPQNGGSTSGEEGHNDTEEEGQEGTPRDNSEPRPETLVLTMGDIVGPEPPDIRAESAAWQELEKMAGLADVKDSVNALLTRAACNHRREIQGKDPLKTTLNRVFLGPPGTGKTTVAKLYAQVLAEAGLVSSKEVVFATPGDFIGQYIGESEAKTSKMLGSTIGKVLVIDDAHAFYNNNNNNSDTDVFRIACIDTMISRIHNKPGEDRCVILIGYPDKMEDMFQKSNPGLKRRFPLEEAFRFHDYDDTQLTEILKLKMERETITAERTAMDVAVEVLRRARDRPNFGNGGDVENLLSQAKVRYRDRLLNKGAENKDGGAAGGSTETRAVDDMDDDAPAIVLEPEDFDPEWDRGSKTDAKSSLFSGLLGFEQITQQFNGYQAVAANMRRRGKDPKKSIPFAFIFKGPPGTGKTHTARIIGKVFYRMGFLSTDQVIECSASHLIGQYMGHTAPRVVDLFDRALGKVLFIDEAYRLSGGAGAGRAMGSRSFEDEAVGELVDCMTKPRYMDKMVIVLAGYDREMTDLLKANAGLRGRFPTEISFPPMDAERCLAHLKSLLAEQDIQIRDDMGGPTVDELERVLRLFDKLGMTVGWSNGRDVRTLAGVITAQVYKNPLPEDEVQDSAVAGGEVEADDLSLRISTKELIGFLRDLLRQRIKGSRPAE